MAYAGCNRAHRQTQRNRISCGPADKVYATRPVPRGISTRLLCADIVWPSESRTTMRTIYRPACTAKLLFTEIPDAQALIERVVK